MEIENLAGGFKFPMFNSTRLVFHTYPLVNQHNYGKSQFLVGKPTINGHF